MIRLDSYVSTRPINRDGLVNWIRIYSDPICLLVVMCQCRNCNIYRGGKPVT
jgi:hypothetical protein